MPEHISYPSATPAINPTASTAELASQRRVVESRQKEVAGWAPSRIGSDIASAFVRGGTNRRRVDIIIGEPFHTSDEWSFSRRDELSAHNDPGE